MTPRPPTAVVFDMDGLLLDTERLGVDTWRDVLRRAGRPAGDEVLLACIGLTERDTGRLLRRALGSDVPYERLSAERRRLARRRLEAGGVPLKPGVPAVFAAIEALGLPAALATSTARAEALALLGSAGLRDRFAVVVSGDEVGRGKPHPDIFLRAARALGRPAAGCLVLEDSANGVRAALAAGMTVCLVPDIAPVEARLRARCYAVLPDLDAAARLLLRLAGRGGEAGP